MKLELLKSILLDDFPSGSSINYHNEKLYLTGDDATHILILNRHYTRLGAIPLFKYLEKRIPKSEKTDLEASTIGDINETTYLMIFGSASRKKRKRLIIIPFSNTDHEINKTEQLIVDTSDFIDKIKLHGIEEVNIEGACIIQDKIILGNRGNRSLQKNHLIVTQKDFWQLGKEVKIHTLQLVHPVSAEIILGVSELCYVPSKNMLLIVLTCEATDNAYDDGEIGDSYLAWIKDVSSKLYGREIKQDGMINLSNASIAFDKQKIEGLCVENLSDNYLILHLASDNDSGSTRLFNVKLWINDEQ